MGKERTGADKKDKKALIIEARGLLKPQKALQGPDLFMQKAPAVPDIGQEKTVGYAGESRVVTNTGRNHIDDSHEPVRTQARSTAAIRGANSEKGAGAEIDSSHSSNNERQPKKGVTKRHLQTPTPTKDSDNTLLGKSKNHSSEGTPGPVLGYERASSASEALMPHGTRNERATIPTFILPPERCNADQADQGKFRRTILSNHAVTCTNVST